MCGITGFLDLSRRTTAREFQITVSRMSDTLLNRGPDDTGLWYDAKAGVGLGHRRLSVIDLSSQGHQPMSSESGRYYIVYNGEVYNFNEIKKEIQSLGHAFRGHSDTEVLLATIEQWGLKKAVTCFIGMFAFALWDRRERILHLVRDRIGIKPLYYGRLGKAFVFASELKAFKVHPEFRGEIDRNALALMMRHNCIPAPHTIFQDIYKLLPGHILSLKIENISADHALTPYWTAKKVVENGITNPFSKNEIEAADYLDALLRDAVKKRMIADVPLGAFLSGGVDSSLVVALMQAQSIRPVKTFTIGFYEDDYNEAKDARKVAQHLGTEHTELYVTPKEAMEVIPKLPTLYDEPFSDSSQIPTFLVSQLTRKHVTVSLSGDGGDELFGGYNRHLWGRNIWQKFGWMPNGFKATIARGLTILSPRTWDVVFGKLVQILPEKIKQRNFGDKLHKLAEILAVESPEAIYHGLVSHWKNPSNLVIGATEPPTVLTDRSRWADLHEFSQRMMFLDLITYLPDDILAKVDRASMGVSLEARVPILDHRVVEFAWSLPISMKIRNGQGKWILRQVLYKYVPKKLIERPKAGFGIPIDTWIRGPLRDWADSLLEKRRLREEGFFNPQPIRQKWKEHLSGKRNWQYCLWDVLMFQLWQESNKN